MHSPAIRFLLPLLSFALAHLAHLATGNAATPPAATLPADHAERMARGLQTFNAHIRPLLLQHCVKCHGGEKTRNDFDLTTREGLLKGGSGGSAIQPFRARDSRLLRLLAHTETPHMPDHGEKLAAPLIARVASWIDDGAPYDAPLIAGRKPARDRSIVTGEDRQWWAFQPLAKAAPPELKNPASVSPVDRFLLAKAAPKNLTLAPPAEKRVLLRRAFLDLHGLPPTPAQIEEFLQDRSPDAWPRLIDRLLDSPRYGERWARHWLDVARFAESSGFEHDYDRTGAFHYRDFVIKALNSDLPFDQFLRWQLAGDEFEPENPLALSATGFLGAGVFPTQITANEVERTRYDALDDMLSTTGSAFLGLTIGCARCHEHKYDPIPNEDYYRLLATFTTTVRSVVDLELDPEKVRDARTRWEAARAPLAAELQNYETTLEPRFATWLASGAAAPTGGVWNVLELTTTKSRAGAQFKRLTDLSYLAEGPNGATDQYTFTANTALRRLTGLRLEALADPSLTRGGPGRAGNGNFALSRVRVFVRPAHGTAPEREIKLAAAVADFEQNKNNLSIAGSIDDNPKTGWAIDPQFGKDHQAVFTFAEPVDFPDGSNLRVTLDFELNQQHNLGRVRLAVIADAEPTLKGDDLPGKIAEILRRAHEPAFAASLTPAQRETLRDWWRRKDSGWRERNAKLAAHAKSEPGNKVPVLICAEGYKPVRMHTQGADFFPETHFLRRGSTDLKTGVAPPGFLQVLTHTAASTNRWQWQPPAGAKYSGRRRSLANWMTDVEHGAGALVARVAVNRLWQHHFGRGIVASPDDFGRTGTAPTHPELLDWLAGQLVDHGWRLKSMHKLLMTSSAYQQTTAPDRAREALDPDNTLFLRRLPRRLEAEAIRDSLLAVSGQLDTTMFGAGTKDERSPRRSIYFTMKRSQLIGSMVAFDQPEPLVSQGARPTTTVAPQALLLMNGPQVRAWAEAFARRLTPHTDPADALHQAYLLALGRPPRSAELTAGQAFLATQTASYTAEKLPDPGFLARADFCQVLFGLNEFAYEN